MPEPLLLFSCEHAVNRVPDGLRGLFEDHEELLDSHRAYDSGALELAEELARTFSAPLFCSRVTRLLIDHNRSPYHRGLWSEFGERLEMSERRELVEKYYLPFRTRVATSIGEGIDAGASVLHISVHSFVPVLNGVVRHTDIGFLYDPARIHEAELAKAWQCHLQASTEELRVHRNRPYRGRSDCHQQSYRKLYPADRYLALELEVNQKLLGGDHRTKAMLHAAVVTSLKKTLDEKER